MSSKKWFPLESNPEVMNGYLELLGLQEPRVAFSDVFGLDDDLLAMVPQPVLAVMLVYPLTPENEADAAQCFDGDGAAAAAPPAELFYMKQTIGNACGTVGILHALANNADRLGAVEPGSFLDTFLRATKSMNPEERATYLENDEKLDSAQAVAAQSGQTQNQAIDATINLHFVCFVHRGGVLYELDGRKRAPLPLGPCAEDGLLAASVLRIKHYMRLNPKETNFGITALSAVE